MTEAVSEHSPLLPPAPSSPSESRTRPPRSVTFNPHPDIKTIEADHLGSDRHPPSHHPHHHHHHHHRHGPASPSSVPMASANYGAFGGGPPMIAALNSRLRRRNSYGSPATTTSAAITGPAGAMGAVLPHGAAAQPKIGPQRSSKTAQKLKLLPNPEIEGAEPDEESGRDVYSQYTRIKDPTARRDAARLGKADRTRLPRVTAYCTANNYEMEGLMRFLKGRGRTRSANPKRIDECIYTPYGYHSKRSETGPPHGRHGRHADSPPRSPISPSAVGPAGNQERRRSTGDVVFGEDGLYQEGMAGLGGDGRESQREEEEGLRAGSTSHGNGSLLDVSGLVEGESTLENAIADIDVQVDTPEAFLFEYGVVVIWGMSAAQEQRFLKELAKFEIEKLAPDDVEAEYFNFYYTQEYQARIYNDFIALRGKGNYMTKLAISHALAQSVKTSLFEELIASTIDECKDIPAQIALTGKIALSRTQINMQIGELFILRISIHLNGSVLDTPEFFWVEPQLEPVYQAVRSYLEIDQRVSLLTERMDVVGDLLTVLKDQLSHGHGEKLEWIVIVLIAAEILVAAVNIIVDLYVGID